MKKSVNMGLAAVLMLLSAMGAEAQMITRGNHRPGKVRAEHKLGSAWIATDTVYTYNSEGKVIEKNCSHDGSSDKFEYTYNAGGYVETMKYTSQSSAGEEILDLRYIYDEKIPWLCVKIDGREYVDGQWSGDVEDVCRITRNAGGDITKLEGRVGDRNPQRITIKYDSGGKASEIFMEEGGGGYYTPYLRYTNLEWLASDGQILGFEILDPGSMMGPNRFSRAKMTAYEYGGTSSMSYDLEMEYKTDDSGYSMKGKAGSLDMQSVYQIKDGYGSYTLNTTAIYKYGSQSYTERMNDEKTFDRFGLLLSYKNEDLFDEDEEENTGERMQGDVVYDSVNGWPVSYSVSASKKLSGPLAETARFTFSDYVEVSGVENLSAEREDAETVYFDLQGHRVLKRSLHNGLFIRVKDGKASKILVP